LESLESFKLDSKYFIKKIEISNLKDKITTPGFPGRYKIYFYNSENKLIANSNTFELKPNFTMFPPNDNLLSKKLTHTKIQTLDKMNSYSPETTTSKQLEEVKSMPKPKFDCPWNWTFEDDVYLLDANKKYGYSNYEDIIKNNEKWNEYKKSAPNSTNLNSRLMKIIDQINIAKKKPSISKTKKESKENNSLMANKSPNKKIIKGIEIKNNKRIKTEKGNQKKGTKEIKERNFEKLFNAWISQTC